MELVPNCGRINHEDHWCLQPVRIPSYAPVRGPTMVCTCGGGRKKLAVEKYSFCVISEFCATSYSSDILDFLKDSAVISDISEFLGRRRVCNEYVLDNIIFFRNYKPQQL